MLAKQRGMDFVTITDHDTIDGVLEIAHERDVFISEELTAWFAGDPQAVHVLCLGITPDDHDWLQAHNRDLVACAKYVHDQEITAALAHPFYQVAAPLTAKHRHTLARLFPTWETRNGMRLRELNAPAAFYIETHGGVAVGGSDDHAGVDIGRTYTQAPFASSPEEFLEHVRNGRVVPGGDQGSPAKLAHSALILAARSLAPHASLVEDGASSLDAPAVLDLAKRIMLEAQTRQESGGSALAEQDVRRLLTAWLSSMGLDLGLQPLLECFQTQAFSHAALQRRARHTHERALARTAAEVLTRKKAEGINETAAALFASCLPAVPYLPAGGFLAREQATLGAQEGDPTRVAVIADGIGSVHGLAHTISQLRERGIDGHELDVIGTDANVDRRLAAVAELELPQYPGLSLGVPSLLAVGEALAERAYDVVHVCAPGPAGSAAALIARIVGLPLVGSYHTELQSYVRRRTGDGALERVVAAVVGAFYRECDVVLAPSSSAEVSLLALGVEPERIRRWTRGVDVKHFNPSRRTAGLLPGKFNVLYVGRISQEKGIDVLSEAFAIARDRDPGLHLVLAGGGPEEDEMRRGLGTSATFLGWLEADELARVYASADLFLFASTTDTFGQVILEAQASGLPVLAVDSGGHTELIEDGYSGCLAPPDPGALAAALGGIARRGVLRQRLSTGGLNAVRGRDWGRSFGELAAGYRRALETTKSSEANAAEQRERGYRHAA
jgi:glycosyltransferase involved in cell wall biosynthesis